jgi:hypothetical protein
MEDSLKGIYITLIISGLFITSILSFITFFLYEQGVVFINEEDRDAYLEISQNTEVITIGDLNNLSNSTDEAFNQWDITTGFMGTNQLKQSQEGIQTNRINIFTSLNLMATELFGANSAIIYALGILASAAAGYIVYMTIKWVRTGA